MGGWRCERGEPEIGQEVVSQLAGLGFTTVLGSRSVEKGRGGDGGYRGGGRREAAGCLG